MRAMDSLMSRWYPRSMSEPGDIFIVPLADGVALAARVALDVSTQCVEPGRIAEGSPLAFFDGCVLVEVCAVVAASPVFDPERLLIPGVFIDDEPLRDGRWQVVGNLAVDPLRVDFPEGVIVRDRSGCFHRGELALPVALTMEEVRDLDVFPTIKGSGALAGLCSHYLGLEQLESVHRWLDRSDLRFSEHRERIYRLLREDMAQSYATMAEKHGYDVTRFYPPAPASGPVEPSLDWLFESLP